MWRKNKEKGVEPPAGGRRFRFGGKYIMKHTHTVKGGKRTVYTYLDLHTKKKRNQCVNMTISYATTAEEKYRGREGRDF